MVNAVTSVVPYRYDPYHAVAKEANLSRDANGEETNPPNAYVGSGTNNKLQLTDTSEESEENATRRIACDYVEMSG